jgi:peptidoglycan hydrolase-like protein with peptidoglycan-binding domain
MFGKYKQSITDILVRKYPTKKLFKKTFHNLMQGLKENKLSREFFVLYGEVENKRFNDKDLAEAYLNEVIKTLKSKKKNLKIPIIKEQNESDLTDDGTIVCVTGGQAKGRGAGAWVAVDKMVHRDKLGNVVVGTVATTDGSETKVTEVWKDSEGRPSAFKFANKNTSASKICFSVASTKKSGFVNKTVNYKQIEYTLDDIKSGKATAKIGDKDKKGEVIKTIQKLVGAKPDGFFGPKTLAKVKEYQKSKNFSVTGKIDKESLGGGTSGPTKGEQSAWKNRGYKNPASGKSGHKPELEVGAWIPVYRKDYKKTKDGKWVWVNPADPSDIDYDISQSSIDLLNSGDDLLELSEGLSPTKNNIYSQLDSLIFNDSVRSIEKNLRNKRSLIEHLTRENKVNKTNGVFSNSIFSKLAVRKYNEKYSSLNEEDKTKLKNLLNLSENEIIEKIETLKENTLKQLGTIKVAADKQEMKNKIQKVTESVTNSDNDILSIIKIENLNKSLIK